MSDENEVDSLRDSAKLPITTLIHAHLRDPEPNFWQRHRRGLAITALFLVAVVIGSWVTMNNLRPFSTDIDIDVLNQELVNLNAAQPSYATSTNNAPDAEVATGPDHNPKHGPRSIYAATIVDDDSDKNAEETEAQSRLAQSHSQQLPAAENSKQPIPQSQSMQVTTWRPNAKQLYWDPQDSPNLPADATRVFVITVRAKVTAYTAYDHAITHPEWADGVVAWHPRNRKRRVEAHPYCLATDWSQFPGGATFIRVPGYMDTSFPNFPQSFRVVDDKCGRARRDKRDGGQPVIDVRYRTLHSAINGRDAWGMKQLDVDVIFPANFAIPQSLKRWIKKAEWRTYQNGTVIKRESVY